MLTAPSWLPLRVLCVTLVSVGLILSTLVCKPQAVFD